ncbi:MAG TPA: DJ-1/PfpI family protein [Candidatus Didemnitutus sp.]|jgi:transcriptional regulator GlxA family with amidase domain
MRRTVGILVFDDVEVLDFAGPFEVFAVTDSLNDQALFQTTTMAENAGTVRARNGLKVVPEHTLESVPRLDVLVVPGGFGTRPLLRRPALLEWIRQSARRAEVVVSICTGSLVLGAAGLLEGLGATTHHRAFAELRAAAPTARVEEGRRFVDNGAVVTAAGISAGIDVSLHLVARLAGREVARRTADYMEYRWLDDAGGDRSESTPT